MFDPLTWLETFETVAADPSEANVRAAVNRAYYAMFLRSCIQLEHDKLFSRTGGASDHKSVSRTLGANKRAAAKTALDTLYRMREHADYHEEMVFGLEDIARARDEVAAIRKACEADWNRAPIT